MTEQMTALAENYPAAAELLRRHGGETLLTYLGQLHHRPLPDILPSEDLLTEVRDYFTPFSARRPPGNVRMFSGAAAACPPPTTIIPRSST